MISLSSSQRAHQQVSAAIASLAVISGDAQASEQESDCSSTATFSLSL